MRLSEVEDLCNEYGIRADIEKSDQHFMINEKTIKEIVKAAEICEKDVVLEVGPGLGFLTEELVKKAGKVIAVEIDEQFKPVLQKLQEKYSNLEVIYGNILKIELPEFNKIISNIAYNLAEPLFMKILYAKFDLGVFTLSMHLAEKLALPEKQEDRIRLSIISQSYFKSEIVKEIPANDFYPAPKIESAILKFSPVKKEELKGKQLLIRLFFEQRYSKVKNALRNCINEYLGKTKRESRQAIAERGFSEGVLEKLVDNISSEEFEIILGFFNRLIKMKED